jgi:hypothetical protein
MVGEGPGVALTPEAVHERIHVLDERAAVELGGQQRVQLAEGVLEKWVVVARLEVPLCVARWPALPLAAAQPDHRHLVEDEIWQGRLVDIGIAQLDAEADALPVLLRHREGRLPIRIRIQAARTLLQLSPRRPDVELLSQRQLREGLDRLLHVHALEGVAAEVAGDVGDEAHAVAGHDVPRRRRGHHDVGPGEHLLRRVLRKRTLIEAVVDGRRGAPVVAVPVVRRDEGRGGTGGGSGSQARGAHFEKRPPVHSPPSGRTPNASVHSPT